MTNSLNFHWSPIQHYSSFFLSIGSFCKICSLRNVWTSEFWAHSLLVQGWDFSYGNHYLIIMRFGIFMCWPRQPQIFYPFFISARFHNFCFLELEERMHLKTVFLLKPLWKKTLTAIISKKNLLWSPIQKTILYHSTWYRFSST